MLTHFRFVRSWLCYGMALLLMLVPLMGRAATNDLPSTPTAIDLDSDAFRHLLADQSFSEQLLTVAQASQGFREYQRPEKILELGGHLLAQLKLYWQQHPALQEEVAIETVPAAQLDSIYIVNGTVTTTQQGAENDRLRTLVEKFNQQGGHDSYKINLIESKQFPRQAVLFKYIGNRDPAYSPTTALGNYLKNVLGPKEIMLEFDPQENIITSTGGAFRADFENHRSVLFVGIKTFQEILEAPAQEDFQKHPILAHELGHYQVAYDVYRHKIPLLAGRLVIMPDSSSAVTFPQIMKALGGDPTMARQDLAIEEAYTYPVTMQCNKGALTEALKELAVHPDLATLKKFRASSQEVFNALGLGFFYANPSEKVVRALDQSTDRELGRLFFYNKKHDEYFLEMEMTIESKEGDPLSFPIKYILPNPLCAGMPIVEDPTRPNAKVGPGSIPVAADASIEKTLQAFIKQQATYIRKVRDDMYILSVQMVYLDSVVEMLIGALEKKDATTDEEVAKILFQLLNAYQNKIFPKIDALAAYPPYFVASEK